MHYGMDRMLLSAKARAASKRCLFWLTNFPGGDVPGAISHRRRRTPSGRHRVSLASEPLECRVVLDATMTPAILGTVYQDLDASGDASPGEYLAGVSVQLVRDDGDGVFEATDPVVSTLSTDAQGEYCFGSLDPDAGYFVLRPAQQVGDLSLDRVVSPLIRPGDPGTLIDQFRTRQLVQALPPAPSSDGSVLTLANETEVIGRERDLFVELLSGIGEVSLSVNPFGLEDLLEFRNGPATLGGRVVTWDGIDGDSQQLALNLGSRDLTRAGGNTGIVLRGGVDASGQGTSVLIRLYDNDIGTFSQAAVTLPVTGGEPSAFIFIPFEDFAGAADITSIDAIQMVIADGGEGTDGKIALIGAIGPKRFDLPEATVADLSVTKTNGLDAVVPGQRVEYEIEVRNNGPDAVSGARVTDQFPTTLVNVQYTSSARDGASGNTRSGTGAIEDLVNLPAGASILYVVQATVAAEVNGEVENRVQVIPPAGVIDPNVTNNTAIDRDLVGAEVDLGISKDDGRREVTVGDRITYRINVRNFGPVPVQNARVTDVFVDELTDVTYTSSASAGASGNTASGAGDIDDLLNLPVGAVITYVVSATVGPDAAGTLLNVARIEPPAGMVDINRDNNVGSDVNLVRRELTDVSITKTNGLTTVSPGQSITYSIVVRNAGPGNAAGVNVLDQFSDELLDVTYTSQLIGGASGATASGFGDIDDMVSLPAGSSIIYTVSARVSPDATGVLENTATASAPPSDTDLGNNTATDVDVLGVQADLAVTKNNGVATVRPGDPVTYTVVVTNNGPSDVVGAQFQDALPENLIDVRYTRQQNGTTVEGVGAIDDLLDLAVGTTVTYTIQATVAPDATGSVSNTAIVNTPQGVIDPRPTNNTATDVDQILRAVTDLAIRKTSVQLVGVAGRDVRYTILVSNVGQTTVTGARVVDDFPAELQDVQYTSRVLGQASGNTSGGGTRLDDTLTLEPGAAVIYEVQGRLGADAAGALENTARVTLPPGQTDVNPGNNISIDVLPIIQQADLAVTKSDGLREVETGQSLTYEIVVSNLGPSDVTGATLTDHLPFGLESVSYQVVPPGQEPSAAVPVTTTAFTTGFDLAAGASLIVRVSGIVAANASGAITNTVRVRGPLELGFEELDPTNNFDQDTDQIAATIVLGSEPTVIRADELTTPGVTDRFKITAHQTGKLIITTHFDHDLGDLQLAVDDQFGNPIDLANSATDNEKLVIPVVGQEPYFVRIFGATGEEVNRYDLEIENFAAPIPQVLRLTPGTDSGMMDNDAVTNAQQPTVIVQADLAEFLAMGVPILEPLDPAVDNRTVPAGPGAAVEITLTNTVTGERIVGYGSAIGEAGQLFSFTPLAGEIVPGGDYAVTAAVRIFDGLSQDGQPAPATGRTQRSDPFWITIDRIAPVAADRPDLLDASDTGMSFRDNVTNSSQPIFRGRTEPNAKVRILARRLDGELEVVGRGVATTEGFWEIRVDPLADDVYHIRAEYEDLAGNISDVGEPLIMEVDTTPPNTPLLDLLRVTDTGFSNADDVTSANQLTFSMTTEDPRQSLHMQPFNYKFRLFVRPDASNGENSGQEILLYDSSADPEVPVANLLDGLTDLEQLIRTVGPLPDGVHHFKLEVEDRAGNISMDYLLPVTIDTVTPPANIELLPSSDSGMSNDDRVTNKMEPAFEGVSEVGTTVNLFANGRLVGRAQVGSDATDGILGNGLGRWEITSEPLADGNYQFAAQFEDLAGNVSVSDPLEVWIDTREPNVPLLDLVTDTGSGLFDNVTRDATPSITITAAATNGGGANPFPNDIKYRVYDRPGDGTGEVLLIDSFGALGDYTSGGFFTEILPELSDGAHNLKVEIEDRAGNISHAFLLDIIVDTDPPLVGRVNLLSSSDSGMLDNDAVTRINQPTFRGIASAGDTVYVYANEVLVGTTIVGSDETDGAPGDGLGVWELSIDPLDDGDYTVRILVEDLAGNTTESDRQSVTIDTTRPNIPLIDLLSDTGDPTDNITSVVAPVVGLTLNDTPDGGDNPFPHDVKYRLYNRPGDGPEVLLYDSFAELGDFTEAGYAELTLPELGPGVHNLKLEVEDRAGNISLPYLLPIEIDTSLPVVVDIELAEYSDSGSSNTDRVTNIREPAVLGTGSIGDTILIYANGQLVGRGIVGSDASDGVLGNDRGAWEVTVEPLDDGVYDMVALVENRVGNTATSQTLRLEIDTLVPNTPRLDLLEVHDLGRHNDDNITSAELLSFAATTTDPNASLHRELTPGGQNLKYRIFVRPEEGTEVLLYDSATDTNLAGLLDGLTAQDRIVSPLFDLPEGLHGLKLEVEDRAGNISPDYLLEVLVDRTPYAGTAQIHPDSDTGIPGNPGSFTDGVTSTRLPTFTGTAEANSLVTVTIDGVPAGTAVAIPWDGDDAVQPPNLPYDIAGNWTLQTTVPLSEGAHTAVFTFEDPAGNRTTTELEIVIDTTGPRIINVTRNEPEFPSLFDPKPSSGPDPLIDSIVIHLEQEPVQGPDGVLDPIAVSVATEEGNYILVGDANGNIPIARVELLQGVDDTVQVVLHFTAPLPDDRFTLTIEDDLIDLSGNRLDGESGARAPFEGGPGLGGTPPIFPTGDGVPGGDFVARFTVDSRPEIGTWAAGSVYIDTNGNFRFDPDNLDYINRDIVYRAGFTSDDVFAGNFALPGQVTDGFDKLAVYGRAEGQFRWLVDTDNDGVPNIDRVEPQQVNGLPVAGQFDANADNGDEVGLFDGKYWYFDTNHDFQTDTRLRSSLVGYPIVGDFDGDGFDDLATWADNRFMIDLAGGSLRGWDGFADEVITFGFIGVRERPVAADMDQDGFTDLGLWVPDREGVTDRDRSEWFFLISGGESLLERMSPPDDPIDSRPTIDFTPIPFGPDMYARFGDEFALPIVGNFDPPVTLGQVDEPDVDELPWTNPRNSLDVNDDTVVSPVDALLIINELNGSEGARPLLQRAARGPYLDVNGDDHVTPIDALLILNELNSRTSVRNAQAAAAVPATVDSAQAGLLRAALSSEEAADGSPESAEMVDQAETDRAELPNFANAPGELDDKPFLLDSASAFALTEPTEGGSPLDDELLELLALELASVHDEDLKATGNVLA